MKRNLDGSARKTPETNLEVCPGPECSKGLFGKGLCRGHYEQQRKGKPLTKLTPYHQSLKGKCAGPECYRQATSDIYCTAHYAQKRDTGKLRPIQIAKLGRDPLESPMVFTGLWPKRINMHLTPEDCFGRTGTGY